jgi:steroid delta-isomerase-like uncharacterized protein
MKYLAAVCMLFVCAFANGQTGEALKNTNLIKVLFKAINDHDSVAVAGFFSDTAKLESPNWQGTQVGKAAVTTVYSRYFKGTPDITYTITNMVATNNAVVVEYTFAGQFSNPEGGSPAYMKDKKYSLKGCTRYNMVGGKITASVSYFDQVDFLRQMGFFDQH